MSPILRQLLTIAICWLLSGAASAGELRQKLFMAKSYSGSRDRQYQVFVPTTYTGQDAVPLVMVLHGCRQTEVNMINETRFKDLAERDNFIVVYPFITGFKEFARRERRTVKLSLNNLAVNSYFPGDYRTFDELKSISSRSAI